MVNKDQVKGTAKQASGSVKESAGKMTDSKKTEAKGKAEKAAGKAQKSYGDAKEKIKDSLVGSKNNCMTKAAFGPPFCCSRCPIARRRGCTVTPGAIGLHSTDLLALIPVRALDARCATR